MRAFARIVTVALLPVLVWLVPRAAFADPHTEGVAKAAMQKAANDYASANYAGAVATLKKAAQACGAKNCTPQTKGEVLRDQGTMEFREGDKDAAGKSWNDALALDQTLALSPLYDASDVGAAWEDARAAAGLPAGAISSKPPPAGSVPLPATGAPLPAASHGTPTIDAPGAPVPAPAPPPGPQTDQPTGDFDHDPAIEQREDTPLPIHVEYTGNSKLAQVVAKYKGSQMREWVRAELKSVGGNAYEGLVPCADVTRGIMRYWIQGFDKTGDPAAATGDPKHPFSVAIRDKITSEPPRFPGKAAPRSCEETDCPPGLAGCKKPGGAGTTSSEATAEGGGAAEEAEGGDKKAAAGPGYSRFWVGLSGSVDFLVFSGASDVCRRDDTTGSPINSQGYYCYDSVANADFPKSKLANDTLLTGQAGTASGGLQAGDIRVLLAFDYAITPRILVGARAGYVANAYPGKSAVNQGHALFAPIHVEARATYLLGASPLTHTGFAPMGFAGLGFSEFDGHQSTVVKFNSGAPPQTVDAWVTDAPFFVVLGGGARYQFSPRVAATGALRLNVVIGGNGLMPTLGPEIGVLYGF